MVCKGARGGFGVRLWKDIRVGWNEFSLRIPIFVSNWRRTKFWLNGLVSKCSSKEAFHWEIEALVYGLHSCCEVVWNREG